jgi:hypothetical protein
MLAGFPLLKELECEDNLGLTGNINSLRVLKETLEKVNIRLCNNVEGNFMDLADFPNLKELDLLDTAITGDIRDIGENDFPSVEYYLDLPKGVYGGYGYEFQSITDGLDLMRAVYLLKKKQRPALKMEGWDGVLSEHSPDRYESVDNRDTPPFYICFVEAGSRLGYRWQTKEGNPCEVNWLDPEPDRESGDYGRYTAKLQEIENEFFIWRPYVLYRGFHVPPTEEEYHRLWERNADENDE